MWSGYMGGGFGRRRSEVVVGVSGSGEVRSIQVCEFSVELGGAWEEEGIELSQ
jgi:hypothetical protein